MNFLSHMLRICHLIGIIKITTSYVLFAANLDDFRAIAKKFVPDQFADKLAQAVSDISLKEALRNKEEDEYDTANDNVSEDDSDSKVYFKARNGESAKGTKLNFEELVKKVKKRLEREFKNKQRTKNAQSKLIEEVTTQKVTPIKVKIKTTRRKRLSSLRPKEILITVTTENAYVEAQPVNEEVDYKNTDPPAITPAKSIKKVRGPVNTQPSNIQPSIIYEYDTEQPQQVGPIKEFIQNKPVIPKVKKIKKLKETLQPSQVLPIKEDESMLFEKSSLVKKDSYEDYVTPEKETNIYVSKEKQMLVNKETRYKIENNNPDDKFNIHNKQSIKVKTMKDINNPQKARIIDTTMTTPEEIYYDETVKTVASDEIQARTENLWFEFSDTKNKAQNFGTGDHNENKRVKIGTGIPTRARFTIYTPEYIKKTTPVAEKYNFDEPIPEQDRVRENLKFFGDPVSKVNKKVRLF